MCVETVMGVPVRKLMDLFKESGGDLFVRNIIGVHMLWENDGRESVSGKCVGK